MVNPAQPAHSNTALKGMTAITGYVNYSESTILHWIKTRKFPAKKISGSIWQSDKKMIDKWLVEHITTTAKPKKKANRRGGKSK